MGLGPCSKYDGAGGRQVGRAGGAVGPLKVTVGSAHIAALLYPLAAILAWDVLWFHLIFIVFYSHRCCWFLSTIGEEPETVADWGLDPGCWDRAEIEI